MLLIQVKASKKGGIVVIDAAGEMYPCLEPAELWGTLLDIGAREPKGQMQPVPEALFLRVKPRSSALVIIDPLAEMHHCKDPHELWETVADLIESEEMPQATTSALATQSHGEVVEHEDVQVIIDDSGDERPFRPSEVRDVIEEMVGDAAADLGTSLFKRLRLMSHRGAAPKPGSRKPKRRVKRGDII